ncbi:MAG: hypothetical protein IK048_02330 [Clostridia bacterium]|nr:hypothetical protein [Clostridia bacterium]
MEKYIVNVHETDERMYYLTRMLRGRKIERPTHVFAPNIVVDARTLNEVEDGAYVFLGRTNEEAELLANSRNITLDAYSKNEKFQSVNSRLTAEGTLKIILEKTTKGLFDLSVLVIGFGRTGAAVARLLCDVGAKLTVASNSSVRQAYALAERVIAPKNFDFAPYDVIVNTVPNPIITDKDTMTIQDGTLYIDLASSPAINLEYARYLGADASIYPALPAKTAPYSAGKAIFDYIQEVLNGK